MLISNRSGSKQDFKQQGCYFESEMADVENPGYRLHVILYHPVDNDWSILQMCDKA